MPRSRFATLASHIFGTEPGCRCPAISSNTSEPWRVRQDEHPSGEEVPSASVATQGPEADCEPGRACVSSAASNVPLFLRRCVIGKEWQVGRGCGTSANPYLSVKAKWLEHPRMRSCLLLGCEYTDEPTSLLIEAAQEEGGHRVNSAAGGGMTIIATGGWSSRQRSGRMITTVQPPLQESGVKRSAVGIGPAGPPASTS